MSPQRIRLFGVLVIGLGMGGCLVGQSGKLLSAPSGANATAARHNDEGIQAYNQGQLVLAKQHFEAAIRTSPTLAEAHYNLGMTLYKEGDDGLAQPHFMKAVNLEPGNEVIANSPGLRGVQAPSKSFGGGLAPDGHSHSH